MKRLPTFAAALGAVTLTGAFAFAPTGDSTSPTTATTPSPAAEATESPSAKKTLNASDFKLGDLTGADVLPPPTNPAWEPPAGYSGLLQAESWVQVTGTGSCLNVRVAPALVWQLPEGDQPVPTLNCLPDGFIGQLSFGPNAGGQMPVQADGHWWWPLLGQGWVAEDWLVLHEAPDSTPRPDLAAAGKIAFVRDDGVWLMNADGTEQRLILAVDSMSSTVGSLDWSPDGAALAASVTSWSGDSFSAATTVLSEDGAVISTHPGIAGASWSPDGRMFSALRVAAGGDMGGYDATPVVLDIASGRETAVGARAGYLRAPEWLPDGSAVSFVCRSWWYEQLLEDGTIDRQEFDCGGDGLRTVSVIDGSVRVVVPVARESNWMDNPSWSPDGTRVAMFATGNDSCRGYNIFSAQTGALLTCLAIPEDTFGGRCGGDSEMGASDWTPDGRVLAYHWQSGAGQNGVALVDVATGERRMIPTTGASSISFSRDGAHLSYESAGYVWTADSDATDVTRVTDGRLPAWQPQR